MKKVKLFEEFLVESQALIHESSIGDIHIMAQESDSFTAFRKSFMDEYGKPKSVKELKQLEAWLQTIWNENESLTNEALSMDAVYIHQITGSGQDSAQNFIDDNNIDSAKLVAYLKQHKDSKEKYDVRDMINGTNKNKRFIKQFVNESKEVFPNEIVGNDQILFKKEWEKMNGGKLAAKYNQYYRGYDIDAGGHIFGSVDELERFMKNYILSNNLYNKYKYMPEIPIKESNSGIDSDIKKLETLIKKQFNVVEFKAPSKRPSSNEEYLMVKVKDDKYGGPQSGLGKFIKRWTGVEASFVDNYGNDKVYWVSLEEIENGPGVHESLDESMKVKDFFKDPMNAADAKGWVRNLKLSDDEIKTKIKAVMKDPSKFNDLMDAMTDELNLKWK